SLAPLTRQTGSHSAPITTPMGVPRRASSRRPTRHAVVLPEADVADVARLSRGTPQRNQPQHAQGNALGTALRYQRVFSTEVSQPSYSPPNSRAHFSSSKVSASIAASSVVLSRSRRASNWPFGSDRAPTGSRYPLAVARVTNVSRASRLLK